MTSIEQSQVYPEVYFVKVGDATIKTDEESIKELIRSAMSTVIGRNMLKEYLKRIKR
jgi:hypothetical protein